MKKNLVLAKRLVNLAHLIEATQLEFDFDSPPKKKEKSVEKVVEPKPSVGWQQGKAKEIRDAIMDLKGTEVLFTIRNRKSGKGMRIRVKPPVELTQKLIEKYSTQDASEKSSKGPHGGEPTFTLEHPGEANERYVKISKDGDMKFSYIGLLNVGSDTPWELVIPRDDEGFPLFHYDGEGKAEEAVSKIFESIMKDKNIPGSLEVVSISKTPCKFLNTSDIDRSWRSEKRRMMEDYEKRQREKHASEVKDK